MRGIDIKKNLMREVLPIYIICGEDNFLKRQVLNEFKSIIDGVTYDFNISDYYGLNEFEELKLNLQTPALMSSYRLIIWHGDIRKTSNSNLHETVKWLSNYLKNPNPTAVLLILDVEDNFKELHKLGDIIDCKRLNNSELLAYINDIIKKEGYIIDSKALNELILRCNFYIDIILLELEKIYILCSEDKIITIKDINEFIASTAEYDVFKLTDALNSNDNKKALTVLNSLLARGESPNALLALLISNFRRMFYAKISKLSDAELAVKLKVKPYSIKIARDIAVNYSATELKVIVEYLLEMDYNCKSGGLNYSEAINTVICKLLKKRS